MAVTKSPLPTSLNPLPEDTSRPQGDLHVRILKKLTQSPTLNDAIADAATELVYGANGVGFFHAARDQEGQLAPPSGLSHRPMHASSPAQRSPHFAMTLEQKRRRNCGALARTPRIDSWLPEFTFAAGRPKSWESTRASSRKQSGLARVAPIGGDIRLALGRDAKTTDVAHHISRSLYRRLPGCRDVDSRLRANCLGPERYAGSQCDHR